MAGSSRAKQKSRRRNGKTCTPSPRHSRRERGADNEEALRENEKICHPRHNTLGGNNMSDALPVTEQTIAARLERLPYSGWHITITAVLGVAIFFDSFDSLAIAYVLPVLVREWHIPPAHIGLLISSANFGQAVGALTFGWIAERIGRVSAARIAIGIFAVMSFACAATHSYDQLIVCRFIQGIGLGGEIPVASTYISEILRADRRGGRFLTYQIIFPVGLLMSGVAGASVVPRFGWQWMFILGAIPGIVALVMQRFCPESPRWLASRGRLEEADSIVTEIESVVSHHGARPLPPVPELGVQPLGRTTRWQELFESYYRSRTLLVWVIWASCYIIAYGLQGWIPTLYREVYHLPLQQALNYAIFSPAGSLIGSLICAFLIDTTGRRYWFTAAFFLTAAVSDLARHSRRRHGVRHAARIYVLLGMARLDEHDHLPLHRRDLSDADAGARRQLGQFLAARRRDGRTADRRLRAAALRHQGRVPDVFGVCRHRLHRRDLHDRDAAARAGGGVARRPGPNRAP